jgi:hypothetical protein
LAKDFGAVNDCPKKNVDTEDPWRPHKLDSAMPKSFSMFVDKLLSKELDKRHKTAQEALDELIQINRQGT